MRLSLRPIRELHWPLIAVVMILSLIGLLMMLSAGGGDLSPYAWPQIVRFGIALALMFSIAFIPMRLLLTNAYLIYMFFLITLVVVDVIGHIGMGAQRWVKLGGMNLQPSEFMKMAVILALARYFHYRMSEDIPRIWFVVIPIFLLVVPAALILRQPNLGTTVITVAMGGMMCFMAGVQYRYFIGAISAVVAAAPIAWQFLHGYQRQRVLTFLDPAADPLGSGYNILQSMIAIGSGDVWGKGYLHGSQGQLNFLPEKQTDFIFTMLAEEWGFVGGMTLLGLYALLIIYIMMIGVQSRNYFGAMIASGVAAMLFIHLMINVAMVMGMIPVVGVPLPFLSYGGSIMLSTMVGMGLVLNVHRNTNRQVGTSMHRFS